MITVNTVIWGAEQQSGSEVDEHLKFWDVVRVGELEIGIIKNKMIERVLKTAIDGIDGSAAFSHDLVSKNTRSIRLSLWE